MKSVECFARGLGFMAALFCAEDPESLKSTQITPCSSVLGSIFSPLTV